MLTLEGWRASGANSFDDYASPYCKIGECLYWYFLEILPPIYCNNGFMVGEPYSYCGKYNTQTYACFIRLDDNYYYLGNISPLAVNDETEKLKQMLIEQTIEGLISWLN